LLKPAPLPTISFLVQGLLRYVQHSKRRGWAVKDYFADWYLGGAEALAALVHNHQSKGPTTILIPAFFCGQSLRFLRQAKVIFVFYPLTDILQPDYSWIESLLEEQQVSFLIHVHYFGQVATQNDSRRLCDKHGIQLIEDCAHLIHPDVHSHWMGDYLIFSPHKYFPVSQGGMLYAKKKYECKKTVSAVLFPWLWYLKQFVKSCLPLLRSKRMQQGLVWSAQSEVPIMLSPSIVEKELLESIVDDLDTVIEKRSRNRSILTEKLIKYGGWWELSHFEGKDVPYLLGMRCSNLDVANKRRTLLTQAGAPIMQWPDLPVEIRDKKEIYKKDIQRTEETIYFFLHEQLNIGRYVECIHKALNGA
jgi:hypothetical protein